jgi:hypothetical protein
MDGAIAARCPTILRKHWMFPGNAYIMAQPEAAECLRQSVQDLPAMQAHSGITAKAGKE